MHKGKKTKLLPLGISDFKKIIEEEKVYVDKTEYIYKLLESDYYFLSRPRRFGKSLLISTLYYLFKGERELFKDLWIAKNTDFPFKKHPVIRIDFSSVENRTTEEMEKSLKLNMKAQYKTYTYRELDIDYLPLKNCFKSLILDSTTELGEKAVFLIDEYDKPIIDNLFIGNGNDRLDVAKTNRDRLRSFYEVLKDAEVQAVTEFVFITGITKFSRMNIFSALNNLTDITMNKKYSTMLGITEEEVGEYFDEHIEAFAEEEGISKEEIRQKLREYYNGYRFSHRNEKVYNPFSLLNCFENREFDNYWSQTGVPYYLANMLKDRRYYIPELEEGVELSETDLGSFDLERIEPVTVLFQGGFLTIKERKPISGKYVLGFPNKEVKSTFNSLMLSTVYDLQKANSLADDIFEAFYYGKVEEGLEIYKRIFALVPNTLLKGVRDYEAFYHNLFYMMVSVAGLYATSELLTAKGRIDCVIETNGNVYIIEFKCNQSPEVALRQIEERRYAERYSGDKRRIYLIGINLDTKKKRVEYKIEKKLP